MFVHFALGLTVSEIQVLKCAEWPQTELEHLTVKSTPYTLNSYPWGTNFAPLRSMTSGFQDIAHFKIAIDSNVKHWKKKRTNKLPKIHNLIFHNSLYKFGKETLRWSMHEFLGANLFQKRCRLKFFLPYGPMLTKTKIKMQKSKFWNFANLYTTLAENVPISMPEFLGVNLLCTFRGNFVWNCFFDIVPC